MDKKSDFEIMKDAAGVILPMQMVAIGGLPLTDMSVTVESLIDRGFVQILAKKTGKATWRITASKPIKEDTTS